MGAIGGIINMDGAPVDRARLEEMQRQLVPYGADAQSSRISGSVGMLSCRLAITEEDRYDRQPLTSAACQSIRLMAFDGRLDNRDELKAWLRLDSATVDQMADSALVQAALVKNAEQALPRLLGDFAIAWWDGREKRLCLARDPTGVRPLFWARHAAMLAFASMPAGLLVLPDIPIAINELALHAFLMALPQPIGASYFEGVHKVQSGQLLRFDRDGVRKTWFHRFGGEGRLRLRDPREYVEAAREQLRRAVRRRLRSTGPVASHLSSGLDSTTVTVVAARELAHRNERLLAYTASPSSRFDGSAPPGHHPDEWEGAASVVSPLGNVDHARIFTDEYSIAQTCTSDVAWTSQPIFSPSDMLWEHAIKRDAQSRGIRTLLSSHTGDLTISYEGGAYPAALLGSGKWLKLAQHALIHWKKGGAKGIRQLGRAAFFPHYLKLKNAIFKEQRVQNWPWRDLTVASPAFLEKIDSDSKIREFLLAHSYRPWQIDGDERAQYFNNIDAGEHFALDNCFGIERRDPTADRRLIEFHLSLPTDLYRRNGQRAWLLKEMMAGELTGEILHPRSIGYQAADWYLSIQQDRELIRTIFKRLKEKPNLNYYIDLGGLLEATDSLPSTAKWQSPSVRRKLRGRLLSGLSVAIFLNYTQRLSDDFGCSKSKAR